jgi:hypothetical protein
VNALVLALALAAPVDWLAVRDAATLADGPAPIARDSRGRIERRRAPVAAFMRAQPCPGGHDAGSVKRCRGYKVDHVIPLCAGGPDDPANMQWQTTEAAREKDRLEVAICRRGVRLAP